MNEILEFEIVETPASEQINTPERTTVAITIRLDKIKGESHDALTLINIWKARIEQMRHTDYRHTIWCVSLTSTATQCQGFLAALKKYQIGDD